MATSGNLAFIQQVNDAFARHDTAFFEANLADDVRWTIVGVTALEGKAAFLAEITTMEKGPPPELSITNVIDGGTSVAVEGVMTMVDETGTPKTYAFCDVYRLGENGNGRITAITAYLIELDTGATS